MWGFVRWSGILKGDCGFGRRNSAGHVVIGGALKVECSFVLKVRA